MESITRGVEEKVEAELRRQRRQTKEESRGKRKKVLRETFGWILYIVVVILMTYLIVTYVCQRTKVSGPSMEATLHDGDNLIVDKITYRFRDPERFEIIVFPYQYAEDTYYIKRIIGLPGETVEIIDGAVYINGELLEADVYGKEVIDETKYGIAEEPVVLGANEYFVMGDNRNHSLGVLTRDQLIGRAWIRIYPFDSFEVL